MGESARAIAVQQMRLYLNRRYSPFEAKRHRAASVKNPCVVSEAIVDTNCRWRKLMMSLGSNRSFAVGAIAVKTQHSRQAWRRGKSREFLRDQLGFVSISDSPVTNNRTFWHSSSSNHDRMEHTKMAEPQKNIDFDGPQMQGTHYKRADMAGSHFDGVNLADAQFYACLSKARFTDTNLSEAVFDDINLADASFNNVNLSGAAITNANLSRLTISGVTLADTDIKDADLTGMRINGVLITDLFHRL